MMLYHHDSFDHVYISSRLKILGDSRYFTVLIKHLGFIVQKSVKNKYKICVELRFYFQRQQKKINKKATKNPTQIGIT